MKRILGVILLLGALIATLGACVPATTVQPEQIVVNLSFPEAFAVVSHTVNTQPYPSDKGGWVLTNSDQVGGIILAEMNYQTYNWWTGQALTHVERVSVAFHSIGDNQTGINVSRSSGKEAESLAAAIVRDLTK